MLFYWILASIFIFVTIHLHYVYKGEHVGDDAPLIFLVSLVVPLGLLCILVYILVVLAMYATSKVKYGFKTLCKLRGKLFEKG